MDFIDLYMREFFPFFAGYDFIYIILDVLFIVAFLRIVIIMPLYALGSKKHLWEVYGN